MKRLVENIKALGKALRLELDCGHHLENDGKPEVGDEVNCDQCDSLALPVGLTAYKKTPVFTQETIPKGFRKAHSTKQGTWGLIKVISGQVNYVVDYLDDKTLKLDQHAHGVISPQMEHHLEVIGDVELYVEFYAKSAT